jgi:hypothetical protein
MPINLVEASFDQIRKIPGAEVQNINVQSCNNPTFSADGTNVLAQNAPRPQACDQLGSPSQCPDGTGGLRIPTTVTAAPSTGGAATEGGGTGGATGGATGGVTGGGTGGATGGATGGVTGGGTGGATGGATVTDPATGAVVDPSTGAPVDGAPAACDPDTGLCGPAADSGRAAAGAPVAGAPVAAAPVVGSVMPTTLGQDSGWGTEQVLLVLVALLTLGLVIAPAAAWRYFGQRRVAA